MKGVRPRPGRSLRNISSDLAQRRTALELYAQQAASTMVPMFMRFMAPPTVLVAPVHAARRRGTSRASARRSEARSAGGDETYDFLSYEILGDRSRSGWARVTSGRARRDRTRRQALARTAGQQVRERRAAVVGSPSSWFVCTASIAARHSRYSNRLAGASNGAAGSSTVVGAAIELTSRQPGFEQRQQVEGPARRAARSARVATSSLASGSTGRGRHGG